MQGTSTNLKILTLTNQRGSFQVYIIPFRLGVRRGVEKIEIRIHIDHNRGQTHSSESVDGRLIQRFDSIDSY